LDDLDIKIRQELFTHKGEMELIPVKTSYDYSSGDGKIHFHQN
jgi:hypothetical protein